MWFRPGRTCWLPAGLPARRQRLCDSRFPPRAPRTIKAAGLPQGSVFDTNTGDFEWNPLSTDQGEHEISFIATDALGARTVRTVVVYVGTGAPVATQLRNMAGGTACSPGAISSVSGWFLSASETPLADRSGRSASLDDTRVLVNGAYAPILSASAGQVRVPLPQPSRGNASRYRCRNPRRAVQRLANHDGRDRARHLDGGWYAARPRLGDPRELGRAGGPTEFPLSCHAGVVRTIDLRLGHRHRMLGLPVASAESGRTVRRRRVRPAAVPNGRRLSDRISSSGRA